MSAKAYGAPHAKLAMMCFSLTQILPYSGPVGCDHLVGASPTTGLQVLAGFRQKLSPSAPKPGLIS
jgi:hypothetical protein